MPYYDGSGFGPQPYVAVPGKPVYVLGMWQSNVPTTRFQILNVALAANVATITGTVVEGNIPSVGSSISVRGTTPNSGAFNVSNAIVTAVAINNLTGAGTITFALTGANLTTTAASGEARIPQPDIGETLANGATVAVALNAVQSLAKQIFAEATFPIIPTTATISLQVSNKNEDSSFVTVGTIATVTGGAVQTFAINYSGTGLFARAYISGVTGTGTAVIKLMD